MAGDALYYEDFEVGRRFRTGSVRIDEADIVAFGRAFDPQVMHTDPVRARELEWGGLIASGFHTLALTFRLFADTGALSACGIGGAGLSELRWLKPVRPGDVLSAEVVVLARRPARSGPDRGMIRLQFRAFDQHGEPVLTFQTYSIVRRRPRDAGQDRREDPT